jgi:Holliday junction resolvase RusA-like endonuclease
VNELQKHIELKEKQLFIELMSEKDNARKDWLKTWVNSEVYDLTRRDRDDVRNHIELYSDDLQILTRTIEKFQNVQEK